MESTVYLFVDVETTGKPRDYSAPPAATNNWPRIVQIAWALASKSGDGEPPTVRIVKPVGFTIPSDVTAIHGISHGRALAFGVDLRGVLDEFTTAAQHAAFVVAHNIAFDAPVIQAEFIRSGLPEPLSRLRQRCTMKEATNFCRLPGRRGYKWPTLAELHQTLFGCAFDQSHDAGSDCSACMRCFFRLLARGALR